MAVDVVLLVVIVVVIVMMTAVVQHSHTWVLLVVGAASPSEATALWRRGGTIDRCPVQPVCKTSEVRTPQGSAESEASLPAAKALR